jgi:hypothetical protein
VCLNADAAEQDSASDRDTPRPRQSAPTGRKIVRSVESRSDSTAERQTSLSLSICRGRRDRHLKHGATDQVQGRTDNQ